MQWIGRDLGAILRVVPTLRVILDGALLFLEAPIHGLEFRQIFVSKLGPDKSLHQDVGVLVEKDHLINEQRLP